MGRWIFSPGWIFTIPSWDFFVTPPGGQNNTIFNFLRELPLFPLMVSLLPFFLSKRTSSLPCKYPGYALPDAWKCWTVPPCRLFHWENPNPPFFITAMESSSFYLLITHWYSGKFQPLRLIPDSKGSVIFNSECPVGVLSWKISTNFHISSLLTRSLSKFSTFPCLIFASVHLFSYALDRVEIFGNPKIWHLWASYFPSNRTIRSDSDFDILDHGFFNLHLGVHD